MVELEKVLVPMVRMPGGIRMPNLQLLAAAMFIPFTAAHGQDVQDEVFTFSQLEETTPSTLARFGNRVEIVTADDIKLGGFNDLAQTLQMRVPGLYLAPKNGAFDYVGCSLQGSRCQDILWLIDGVRINNRLYNSTSPLDTVPAHTVERIEILYGGQGIFYGTQAVAGVVNIVTKGLSDEVAGAITVGYDTNSGYHISGDTRGGNGKHRMLLYGSLDVASGFQPFRDGDYQPSGTDRDRGYDVATLGIKYGVDVGENSRLRVHVHHVENEVEWAAPANTARSFNERNETLLTVKYDALLRENVQLFVKAYVHGWDSHWSESENELDSAGQLTGTVITVSDAEYWGYEDIGLTAITEIQSKHGLDYVFGIEHQRYSGRDDVLLIDDQEERVNAFFGQIRTGESLFSNTRFAFGMRHNQSQGDGDITVWNLSGKHTFTNDIYLRGTAGTAFRLPDAWQLYGNDPCCTLGNPDLQGEESRNLNVAVGGETARVTWEFAAFVRVVDNLIGSEDGVRVNTNSEVDFSGFEVSARTPLGNGWSVFANYTMTSAEADESGEQIDDVPESLLKAVLTYSDNDRPVEFSLSAAYVGKLYDSVSGGIGRIEHGEYTVVDLSGGWYIGSGRRHRIGLRVENALDEDYASSLGRAFRDSDGSSYAYSNLGTPRTAHINYRYTF